VKSKKRFTRDTLTRVRTAATVETPHDRVRAVAFRIEDKVYEGRAGASHIALYTSLLLLKQVPADTLDVWTSDEKNHGFVTEKGEFIDRPEVFRRFGAARSQDLRARGLFKTAP
jgi:hypothetical protein